MRLDLQARFDRDYFSRVKAELVPDLPDDYSHVSMHWPGEALHSFLRIAGQGRVSVSTRLHLHPNELCEVDWFTLALDSYSSHTAKDTKWREKSFDALEFLDGTHLVKRFDQFRTVKSPKSNQIGGASGAFFFPSKLVELLEAHGVSGATWTPIASMDELAEWPNVFLLVPQQIIPVVETGPALRWDGAADRKFLMPLADVLLVENAALRGASDFNITSLPCGGYNIGSVVVSRRVRDLTLAHQIRGVDFFPILALNSSLFDEFARMWADFEQLVSQYPNVRLS